MTSLQWKKLIVSLDTDNKKEIERIVAALPSVRLFKVGLIPFVAFGPSILEFLSKKGKQVFLDLKFYDIPNTMSHALSISAKHNVWGLTVHASNEPEALRALSKAKEKLGVSPLLIGVTQLTSAEASLKRVLELAQRAKDAGFDGVVASAHEAEKIKKKTSSGFLVLCPGIRPKGNKKDDQRRAATFSYAVKNKADYAIVGRPIVGTRAYSENAERILTS